MSPNDLRRTFCSWLANNGVTSLSAAKLMGHSSTRMVEQVYAQISTKTLEHALGNLGQVSLPPLKKDGDGEPEVGKDDEVVEEENTAQESESGKSSVAKCSKYGVEAVEGGEYEDVRRMTIRIPLSMLRVAKGREVFKIKVAPATYATGATLPRDRIDLF